MFHFRDREAVQIMPTFPHRWWRSQNRLDIRPVLWSLRNMPQDWSIDQHTITHNPSKHEFWISNGFFFYALYRANGVTMPR